MVCVNEFQKSEYSVCYDILLCNISNTQLAKLILHNTFVTDIFQKAKAPYSEREH